MVVSRSAAMLGRFVHLGYSLTEYVRNSAHRHDCASVRDPYKDDFKADDNWPFSLSERWLHFYSINAPLDNVPLMVGGGPDSGYKMSNQVSDPQFKNLRQLLLFYNCEEYEAADIYGLYYHVYPSSRG